MYVRSNIVIAVIINIFNPHSNTYMNIVSGIEMIEYFKHINHSFLSNIFMSFDDNDLLIIMTYILFALSSVVTLLKLIYEMNLKLNLIVHICSLGHELVNIAIILLITIL